MRKKLVTLIVGVLFVAYILSVEARLYWAQNVAVQAIWQNSEQSRRISDLEQRVRSIEHAGKTGG